MAARATASGAIVFGMVSVPVKLYTAAKPSDKIKFKQLSPSARTLTQQYVDEDDKLVAKDDMLKGYEVSKGNFVTFTQDEIKAVEAVADSQIKVTEFVAIDAVDPVHYDKPYYLAPEKGGARAYHLLATAMRKSNLCAICTYAARGKQYLVMLRPIDRGIVLQQLLYVHEVRSFDEVPEFEVTEIVDSELNMAMQLVSSMTTETFEPAKYNDDVRDRMQAMIDAKVEGGEITTQEGESAATQTIDLMEALKASMDLPETPMQRKGPKKAPKRKTKKKAS